MLSAAHSAPYPIMHTVSAALQDAKADDNRKRFALLCVGELGSRADLTAFPALPDVLTAALGSGAILACVGRCWAGWHALASSVLIEAAL